MKALTPLTTTLLLTSLWFGHAHASEWTYSGEHGPDHWATLAATCATGTQQSPIDITTSITQSAALPLLGFHYQNGSAELINNGHTVQVNLPAGNQVRIGDQTVELVQFHFHTPSEERFNGRQYPLAAHLVHKTADGHLSVIAVEFKEGAANPALQPLLDALPGAGKTHTLSQFNPADLLPADHHYFRFTGSLTTPPCSEQVTWQVIKQPVELSKAQIDAFRALYPMNARPVQPLNGRVVELSE